MKSCRLVLLASLALAVGCGQGSTSGTSSTPDIPSTPGAPGTPGGRVYSTNFSLTEDPISEGGNWINGQAVGLDWKNARTISGLAFGTQTGSNNFDDTVALLTGTWQPDQTVEATVYSVNQNANITEELELRLRSTLSANSCTGHEVLFNVLGSIQIVSWNGPLGGFTVLGTGGGPILTPGDVVKAIIVGSTITAYVNGVQKLQVDDSTYSSGNPGMGVFSEGHPA